MYRSTEALPETESLVHIEQLLAGYGGHVVLSIPRLQFRRGKVYGLVGPNGAGKSTLLQCLAGLKQPFRGSIRIEGKDPAAKVPSQRPAIGWMSDRPPIYEEKSVLDVVQLFCTAEKATVQHVLSRVGLEAHQKLLCKNLSLGQRQRLGIARVLLSAAPLLLLDEPTNGIDPAGRELLGVLLREYATTGAAVVLSSHALRELEAFCDEFVFIDQGKLSAAGNAETLRKEALPQTIIRVGLLTSVSLDTIDHALETVPCARIEKVEHTQLVLNVPADPEKYRDVLLALVHAGIPICSFEPTRASIADLYTEIVKGPST